MTLTDCTVTDNVASNNGGGLANDFFDTMTLTGCTISGNSASVAGGLFNLNVTTLNDCAVEGNSAATSGGGVYNRDGTVYLTGCSVSGNSAVSGAGLFNDGTANLTACTVSGNSTGGGIENEITATLIDCTIDANSERGLDNQFGTVTLTACTVTGNSDFGLANYHSGTTGTIALNDTIVAGNTLNGTATDIGGPDTSDVNGSNNLIGTGGPGGMVNGQNGNLVGVADPLLASLSNYGGPTQTVALLPGSLAIGSGSLALEVDAQGHALTSDQRGEPLDSPPDIGAFQSQGFTLALAGGNSQAVVTGSAFANPLAVTVTAKNAVEPVTGGVVTFTVPSSGASANLSGTTANIDSNGGASVSATANSTSGSYTVTATAAGSTPTIDFSLTNLISLSFSGVTNQSITYGTSSVLVSGTLANGLQTPQNQNVVVTLNGVPQPAQIDSHLLKIPSGPQLHTATFPPRSTPPASPWLAQPTQSATCTPAMGFSPPPARPAR